MRTYNHTVIIHPVFNTGRLSWLTAVNNLRPASLRFVHPMKGDGHAALHFRPGDLRQILGIEDEEVPWSLGAGGHHYGEQHS